MSAEHAQANTYSIVMFENQQIDTSSNRKLLTRLSSTCAAVMDQVPSPSWQGALNSHESETKLRPTTDAHRSELQKLDECAETRFSKSKKYRA